MFDLLPAFTRLAFDQKYLPYGGLLSGFFGGLSGHQGALRAAFLIKCGLSKEAFIGTSTVSTLFVDIARLVVYGIAFYLSSYQAIPGSTGWLVLAATLSAFMGAFIGTRLIRKVTLQTIQWMVGALLVLVGILMSGGLI
jgi:hypothetical protein